MIEQKSFEPEFQKLNHEMKTEIDEAINNGYEVTVGNTHDRAYEKPHKIEEMLNGLDFSGKIYSDYCNDIIMKDLGVSTLEGVPQLKISRARARNEDAFEEFRAHLLFDSLKMPWHLQRGSALALLSIVDAHDFIAFDADNSGKYKKMCGRLELDPSSFTFTEGDNSLAGYNLRDAIIESHQRFEGISLEDASVKADRSLLKLDSFLNAPISNEFKDIVSYCYDSLGIRNRKQEVSNAILQHIDNNVDDSKEDMLMLSVGCGTALSILEVALDIKNRGKNPHVILLDQDPIALASAKSLAEQMGLADSIELHCERLFDQKGQPFDMLKILGDRKLDVAEDTGLREYLPDPIYKNLTNALWNSLSEDGIMTTGNMNANRRQPEFLHGLMGWYPNVIMRNIEKGFELHEQSGIPKGNTRARVTRDGVYTLFFSQK